MDKLKKVYKCNGMNCVDINGTRTYLPNELSNVGGVCINGEYFVKVKIVKFRKD